MGSLFSPTEEVEAHWGKKPPWPSSVSIKINYGMLTTQKRPFFCPAGFFLESPSFFSEKQDFGKFRKNFGKFLGNFRKITGNFPKKFRGISGKSQKKIITNKFFNYLSSL